MHLLWCLNTLEMVQTQKKQKHRLFEREGELELVVLDVCIISTYTCMRITKHHGMRSSFLSWKTAVSEII